MFKKLVVGATIAFGVTSGMAGTALAWQSPYDSYSGPWPNRSACERSAAQLNSNGMNPTLPCHQREGRDGWWYLYSVITPD